jgi:hypothetical protein
MGKLFEYILRKEEIQKGNKYMKNAQYNIISHQGNVNQIYNELETSGSCL